MLTLNGLVVRQFSPNFTTVMWSFASTLEDISKYTGTLYRSEQPSLNLADYDIVTSGINLLYTYQYNDSFITGLTNKFATYYYILVISGLVDQGVGASAPTGITVSSDNIAREIIRLRELVLTRYSGEPFKVLKKKTYGQYCTNYDPTLQQCTLGSACPVCYGTMYVGGFYSPFTILGQLNTQPHRNQITVYGDWQDGDSIMTTSNRITLTPGDIVVDLLGRRWDVIVVNSTNKAMYLIAQQAQLRRLEIVDSSQNIPVINVVLADTGTYSADPNYGITNLGLQ
jgi:hypothetical protein